MHSNVTSNNLGDRTELTLLMPLRDGLVAAPNTMTFASRCHSALDIMFAGRQRTRELDAGPRIFDAIDRIREVHSFRFAFTADMRHLLLDVSFDGPYIPYMRTVWRVAGALLDIILCNCEDYPIAVESSYYDWLAWIQRYQIEAPFFSDTFDVTVPDVQYLQRYERLQRQRGNEPEADRRLAGVYAHDPVDLSRESAATNPAALTQRALSELEGWFALKDYYYEGADARILLRAAHDGLKDFIDLGIDDLLPPGDPRRKVHNAALSWLAGKVDQRSNIDYQHTPPAADDIQPGVLNSFGEANHGVLLFCKFESRESGQSWINSLIDPVFAAQPGAPAASLALTHAGLSLLTSEEFVSKHFDPAFVEGMAQRTDTVGDVYGNHSSRWSAPRLMDSDEHGDGRLDWDTVHAVLQLRVYDAHGWMPWETGHPLWNAAKQLTASGVKVLAADPMYSRREGAFTRGHFGYVDGISNPDIAWRGTAGALPYTNDIPPGELLLGLPNDRDFQHQPSVDELLKHGTYLAIRKIRQNRAALEKLVEHAQLQQDNVDLPRETLLGKMLGRKPDGEPLAIGAPQEVSNQFDYEHDPDGEGTPRQSHIRRVNPRRPDRGLPVPRILRRGMSYGPDYEQRPAADRGLTFMAYCASLSEQFEVLLRWINGGNASHTISSPGDPLLAPARDDDPRTYRFVEDGRVRRVDIKVPNSPPLTEVVWGLYTFVPSRQALEQLAQARSTPAAPTNKVNPLVRRMIDAPQDYSLTEWIVALEDPGASGSGLTRDLLASISETKRGILKTPYGVIITDDHLMGQVLAEDSAFSVKGYFERMDESSGGVFLGRDSSDPIYIAESTPINASLMALDEQSSRELAWNQAADLLSPYVVSGGQLSVQNLIETVLASLCKRWFDVPDGNFVTGGAGHPEQPGEVRLPYHLNAPSRAIFPPHPTPQATREGNAHGKLLKERIKQWYGGKPILQGSVSRTIAEYVVQSGGSEDDFARLMVGVMGGFTPTTFANTMVIAAQWISSGALWELQLQTRGVKERAARVDLFRPALISAMQRRPLPPAIWRTATTDVDLTPRNSTETVSIKKDEHVTIMIDAVTNQLQQSGSDRVDPVFGGHRPGSAVHACPGYNAAMGTMEGILGAILESGPYRRPQSPTMLDFYAP